MLILRKQLTCSDICYDVVFLIWITTPICQITPAYCLFILTMSTAFAAIETFILGNDITGNLDTDTGALTLCGTGAMYDNQEEMSGYEDSVTSIIIEDDISYIGVESFTNYTNLESLTIGKNVANIGTDAFSGCEKLKTIINHYDGIQTIGGDTFQNAGEQLTTKTAICYQSNTTFETAVKDNGYAID